MLMPYGVQMRGLARSLGPLLVLLSACGPGTLIDELDEAASAEASESEASASEGGSEGSESELETGSAVECVPVPEICQRFLRCVDALVPEQSGPIGELLGEGSECWCDGDPASAAACAQTCTEELDKALEVEPTEVACHASSCAIDEHDDTQPYGPILAGECNLYLSGADWLEQDPLYEPLGLAGSFCSPSCDGIALVCPDNAQTTAEGSCFIADPEGNQCVSRCFVDSTLHGGNQCPCGATCQPYGTPDGDGHVRGICTYL